MPASRTLYDGFQPVPEVSAADAFDLFPFKSRPQKLPAPARITSIPPETACLTAAQIRWSSESPALPEKPSPSRSESVPERRAELPILIRDCTRQAVSRLSFGPAV